MHTPAAKARPSKAPAPADRAAAPAGPAAVADNRPVAVAQRQLQALINQSAPVQRAAAVQARIAQSPRQQAAAPGPVQKKVNETGLPDNLKAGVENLSGFSLDDVRVHYNSVKPAEMQAHAYAQGTNIHVAPGQEEHLPHEAWHVVQQLQGRVKPTMQLKGKVPVNDDAGLEQEADVMGAKAAAAAHPDRPGSEGGLALTAPSSLSGAGQTVQRVVPPNGTFKQVPRTVYSARGGKDTPFDKDRHPRSMFSFGTKTRPQVMEENDNMRVGDRIVSLRVITGGYMNPEGVQLDHQVSWDTISDAMDRHNKSLTKWTAREGYSLWDAKMYYNDLDNLKPAPGNLNAAAGAEGVREVPRGHSGVMMYLGQTSLAWANLQAGVEALGPGIADESAERIAILLHQVTTAMNEVTEKLL